MRGGGGVRDQTLAVAEIVRDLDQPERVLEAESAHLAALDRERHERARPAHLLPRQLVLRMAFQTGIEHALDRRVALEILGDFGRGAALPIDAEIERLDAFEQEPRLEP